MLQADHTQDLDLQFAVRALKIEVESSLRAHVEYASLSNQHDEDTKAHRASVATPSSAATALASSIGLSPQAAAAVTATSPTQPARRSSMFSFSTSAVPAGTTPNAAFPVPYHLTAEDRNKWSIFVGRGESIVATALVNKPNPVGKTLMRQLILTTGNKLIYVDAEAMVEKGTIDVTRGVSLWQICKAVS